MNITERKPVDKALTFVRKGVNSVSSLALRLRLPVSHLPSGDRMRSSHDSLTIHNERLDFPNARDWAHSRGDGCTASVVRDGHNNSEHIP